MMIPPFFTSCSSSGCTSTRSPSGLTLTAAIGFFLLLIGFGLSRRLSILATAADRLLLLFLVFVHDFELGVDDVAFALAGAFFSTRTLLRFRARLRPGTRTRLR